MALSRAAAEIGGLDEGAYGHWLNEMCVALRSGSPKEQESAKHALARLQKLSALKPDDAEAQAAAEAAAGKHALSPHHNLISRDVE